MKTLLPGEFQWLEITTVGEINKHPESIVIEYMESPLTGMEKTKTTMTLKNDDITIKREGSFQSELTFAPEASKLCLYSTPYGTVRIKTDTSEYSLQDRDGEYFLSLNYGLTIEGEYQGETAMEMLIQQKE